MPKHIAYKLPLSALDIVAIDDNQPMRQILYSIIHAFGIARLRIFANGESALQDMMDDPPNLVITDWHMKPVNGYEVVRTMRHKSSRSLSLVPVIMLTGFASRSFVQKSFDVGVQQFLIKPVSPNALLKRIKWILNDERELVLKDDFYVCAEELKVVNEKATRNKARVQILLARMMVEKNNAPGPAHTPAHTEEPEPAQAAVAQTGGRRHEQWEI